MTNGFRKQVENALAITEQLEHTFKAKPDVSFRLSFASNILVDDSCTSLPDSLFSSLQPCDYVFTRLKNSIRRMELLHSNQQNFSRKTRKRDSDSTASEVDNDEEDGQLGYKLRAEVNSLMIRNAALQELVEEENAKYRGQLQAGAQRASKLERQLDDERQKFAQKLAQFSELVKMCRRYKKQLQEAEREGEPGCLKAVEQGRQLLQAKLPEEFKLITKVRTQNSEQARLLKATIVLCRRGEFDWEHIEELGFSLSESALQVQRIKAEFVLSLLPHYGKTTDLLACSDPESFIVAAAELVAELLADLIKKSQENTLLSRKLALLAQYQ